MTVYRHNENGTVTVKHVLSLLYYSIESNRTSAMEMKLRSRVFSLGLSGEPANITTTSGKKRKKKKWKNLKDRIVIKFERNSFFT